MLKKVLLITSISFASILLLLTIIPFAFKDKIELMVKEHINNQLKATISYDDLDISFIRHFPHVSVDLENFAIVNKAPFKGDTLAAAKHVYFKVNFESFFEEIPTINSILLEDANINIKYDKFGNANYDITIPEAEQPKDAKTTKFKLAIESYEIRNSNFLYDDAQGNMQFIIKGLNHIGKGDLTQEALTLATQSNAKSISFIMDGVPYLKNIALTYNADIGVNYQKDLQLTFKNNIADFNDLHLKFNGIFTMLPEAFDMDFDVVAEQSEFKNLLSLVPAAYTANFSNVVANGKLDFYGKIKGQYSDTKIPTLDLLLKTNNASVKYPDLPKTIQNINIDTHIVNKTGVVDDTEIDIKHFGFSIDKDVFEATTNITKPVSNPNIKATFKGMINLGNLANAYPLDLGYSLKGLLKANIETAFDMASIEKEQYQKIQSKGTMEVTGVDLGKTFTPHNLLIQKANMDFNLYKINLKSLSMKTGKSDIQLSGNLENFYGYLFNNSELKAKVNMTSHQFYANDFLSETTAPSTNTPASTTPQNTAQFKLPEKIAFNGNVKANAIHYDNILLTNFKGSTTLKDQKISFNNASANVFKGSVAIDGFVDTKPKVTTYDFKLDIHQFDIASAFNGLEMLQKIAPIIDAFKGRFDTNLVMKGELGNDFTPVLSKLAGNAFANLQVDRVDASKSQFLSLTEQKLPFMNLDKTDLQDIKAKLSFHDGKVFLAPFVMKYKNIPVTISGNHSFDNQIQYNMNFDLPAKYLGKDAIALMTKLNANAQAAEMNIPLGVKVGGTVTKPTVTPGTKDAMTLLTQQLIGSQKEKIKEEVKGKVKDKIAFEANKKLNSILGKDNPADTTKTPQKTAKEQIKIIGGSVLKNIWK